MHSGATHGRQELCEGWQLCALPAASIDQPGQLPAAGAAPWLEAPRLGTAASILRDRGSWSLDGPVREFDAEDWWFSRLLELPGGTGVARLGLDGIATVAELWLDGVLALRSDNMFERHVLELPLTATPRTVRVTLCCRSLDHALARRRPRPRWRTPMVKHQQLRWWRTTLLGRTPGWTPPAAPVGPWRPVWLELPEPLSLARWKLDAQLSGDQGSLAFEGQLMAGAAAAGISARLQVDRKGQCWQSPSATPDSTDGSLTLACDLGAVERWWPHTHGVPALYAVTLQILRPGQEPIGIALGQTGFRSLRLDPQQQGFRLLVNEVPIFCRGACWTPPDPVSLRSDEAACRDALAQVCALGMNMLRISGTLVYEDQAFFRACDALGILVWQDFMFASMDYPLDDPDLAAAAEREARQQLAQWRPHPCLAVLCGNSEGEQQAAMWGAPREQWQIGFFIDTLAACCRELCPQVPYWPSSAHGGAFPHQVDSGTTSYYGVGAYLRPPEDARHSGLRFATECLAFANVPEAATIARMPGGHGLRVHHPGWKARTCRDLNAGWDFEDVRDHYLALRHAVDPMRLRYADHERYLMLSRIVTGDLMARSFAEWRRADSPCGGALVWFLRDLWAGAGWGLLDDRGTRKACAWLLARQLQPTSVALTDEGNNGLYLHLIHEGAQPLDAVLSAGSWSTDGASLWQLRRDVQLAPRSRRSLPLLELCDRFEDFSYAFRFGPQTHAAVAVRLLVGDRVVAEDLLLPGPPGACAPRDADLRASYRVGPDGSCEILLESRAPACHVHFVDANFDSPDQYFHVLPDQARRLHLAPGSCGSEAAPRAMVAASNLRDPVPLLRAEAAPQSEVH